MEVVKGYIDHFVWQNETNGYSVLELVTQDETITCVGIVNGFGIGENVEIKGEYVIHPVYDKQIKISEIKALSPEDIIAVERYLGSGAIKGIGKAMAKKIVKTFGEDAFRIAQEEPERLAEIKGISLKKAYDIGNQLTEKRDIRDAMVFLQKFGISQTLSNKIYKKYGTRMYTVMQENPYKLAEDISGVGFKIADDIALKSGLSVNSDFRIRSGIVYVLLSESMEGNCYYPKEMLIDKTAKMLEINPEEIEAHIMDLVQDNKIIVKIYHDKEIVYSPSYYYEEQAVAYKLIELLENYTSEKTLISKNKWYEKIAAIEKKLNIELDELQKKGVCECMMNGVFVLSGGPGTGKTTTINTILKLFESEGMEFYLAAPTGRAAKRMQEATGYEAKTIHRLLEVNGEISDDRHGVSFERNEDNPLEADAIIIDEMSMVDIHLIRALLKAVIPGTKLILVGDSNQLPSVGPGQVLADILDSGVVPSVRLERIYRQDEGSHIIKYAYKINYGEEIDFSEKYADFFLLEKDNVDTIYRYMCELIEVNIPKSLGVNPFDVQVLTPMKKGGLGTTLLNGVLQGRLNPASDKKREYQYNDTLFREGDKVMQIKNDYNAEWEIVGKYNVTIDKGTGIYNGDIGKIEEINTFSKTMKIVFDDNKIVYYPFENLDELELAYAMTVHKSQGGEYPVIIIPILAGPQVLLTRNLLYTGVTRAQRCVIILGSSATINSMIKNDMIVERYTSLKERLTEANSNFKE